MSMFGAKYNFNLTKRYFQEKLYSEEIENSDILIMKNRINILKYLTVSNHQKVTNQHFVLLQKHV